jgi:hypothetical protein
VVSAKRTFFDVDSGAAVAAAPAATEPAVLSR